MKPHPPLPQQYLLPGQVIITQQPSRIYTVLGSCIAVVFHHRRTETSAICHAQLPHRNSLGNCMDPCPVKCGRDAPSTCDFKFVVCCLEYIVADFAARGLAKHELTIKLFGGANVIRGPKTRKTIGESNIEVARQFLQDHHLILSAEDVGGEAGRSLYFYPHNGDIYLKRHRQGNVLTKIIPNHVMGR